MYSDQVELKTLFDDFLCRHKLSASYVDIAQTWFIPMAESLVMHQKSAGGTLFVGVNGTQGSGKSTLCDFLLEYLTSMHNLHVISMSLDDFYYSSQIRQDLAETVHPLFATRGVPGTHDVVCMQKTFEALAAQETPLTIPRFNKATDNPYEESDWLQVKQPVDIVLMEGWCWGVRSQNDKSLEEPVNTLEAIEDVAASWRRYVNAVLKKDYEPLYDYMHYWVMLLAPSFSAVHDWRCEQEHKLKVALGEADPEKLAGLMSDEAIARFIMHYQRLTEHGLASLPETCDTVYELDFNRRVINGSIEGEKPV